SPRARGRVRRRRVSAASGDRCTKTACRGVRARRRDCRRRTALAAEARRRLAANRARVARRPLAQPADRGRASRRRSRAGGLAIAIPGRVTCSRRRMTIGGSVGGRSRVPRSFHNAYYCSMQKWLAGARALLVRSGNRSDDGRETILQPDELRRRLLAGPGEVRELLRRRTRTALGSPRSWPTELLGAVNVCLDAPQPMWLVWGPEALLIYNDAAIPLLGKAHPDALGKRAREASVDLWETAGAAVESVTLSGCPRCLPDRLLMLDSGSTIEERYFEIVASPVLRDGAVAGVLCSALETTPKVQAARRRETLDEIDARMARAADEQEAWEAAIASLERNPADLRYAILYRTDGDSGLARLAGTAGIVPDSRRVPAMIEPAATDTPWPLAHAAELKAPIRWSDALVCPLVAPAGEIHGYLIAGLSPRLEADDDYLDFVESAA